MGVGGGATKFSQGSLAEYKGEVPHCQIKTQTRQGLLIHGRSYPGRPQYPIHPSQPQRHAKYSLVMGSDFNSFDSSLGVSAIPMLPSKFLMSLASTFSPLSKWELFQVKR